MKVVYRKTPRGLLVYAGPMDATSAATLRDKLNARRSLEDIVSGIVYVTRVA